MPYKNEKREHEEKAARETGKAVAARLKRAKEEEEDERVKKANEEAKYAALLKADGVDKAEAVAAAKSLWEGFEPPPPTALDYHKALDGILDDNPSGYGRLSDENGRAIRAAAKEWGKAFNASKDGLREINGSLGRGSFNPPELTKGLKNAFCTEEMRALAKEKGAQEPQEAFEEFLGKCVGPPNNVPTSFHHYHRDPHSDPKDFNADIFRPRNVANAWKIAKAAKRASGLSYWDMAASVLKPAEHEGNFKKLTSPDTFAKFVTDSDAQRAVQDICGDPFNQKVAADWLAGNGGNIEKVMQDASDACEKLLVNQEKVTKAAAVARSSARSEASKDPEPLLPPPAELNRAADMAGDALLHEPAKSALRSARPSISGPKPS